MQQTQTPKQGEQTPKKKTQAVNARPQVPIKQKHTPLIWQLHEELISILASWSNSSPIHETSL